MYSTETEMVQNAFIDYQLVVNLWNQVENWLKIRFLTLLNVMTNTTFLYNILNTK